MKVGVTGGTGFIGQYLVQEYGDSYDFIVPTRQKSFASLSAKAEYVSVNYEKEELRNIFAECDAVVHLGGYVMHGMDYSLETDVYVDNVTFSSNVFAVCRDLNIKNVINASSVAVYDQLGETPVKEEDPCQPNSVYGIMKITVEKLAELYNRRYGFYIKSFRFGQGIGFQKEMDLTQFWTILLKHSLEGKPIPMYGLGKTGRDVIYVKDMAAAIISGLQHPEARGCFNIGTGHICSNKELAETYCKVFHNEGGLVFLRDKEETGIRTCMDCRKAEEELGFTARYNTLKMVRDIKAEYEKYTMDGNMVRFY